MEELVLFGFFPFGMYIYLQGRREIGREKRKCVCAEGLACVTAAATAAAPWLGFVGGGLWEVCLDVCVGALM